MQKGNTQGIMNDKRSQFNIMNDIMKEIVNDNNCHSIVKNSFAHEPDGLLVDVVNEVNVSRLCWNLLPSNCFDSPSFPSEL